MSAPELGRRLALDRDGRARLDTHLAATTAGRLTDRDRWLLRMLAEHQMLTSRHVELLAFTGPRQARARLTLLWRLHALDRVRPDLGLRASPAHYGLGPVGAQLLAAQAGTTAADTGWRPDQLLALASSPRRAHHVGTTSLFTALAHQSRTRPPGHGLTTWWPERRCTRTWGTWARPDGYGTWTTPTHTLHFFAEYDRGTEPLAKVAAKLTGYTTLAHASGITTPVLIWLPTRTRETNLRHRLTTTPTAGGVPVVTGSPDPADPADDLAPAGPAWLPLHSTTRTDLDHLAATHGTPTPPDTHSDADADAGDGDGDGPPSPRPPHPRQTRA